MIALPVGAPAEHHAPAPIATGNPAPDFTYDLGSGPQRLSEVGGRTVLVHFWASWCAPCRQELPLLVRARKEDPALTIITLSDEQPGVAKSYLKKQGIDLPVIADPRHAVFRLYGVHTVPVSVFVGAGRMVEHVSIGEMDWPEIAGALPGVRP